MIMELIGCFALVLIAIGLYLTGVFILAILSLIGVQIGRRKYRKIAKKIIDRKVYVKTRKINKLIDRLSIKPCEIDKCLIQQLRAIRDSD